MTLHVFFLFTTISVVMEWLKVLFLTTSLGHLVNIPTTLSSLPQEVRAKLWDWRLQACAIANCQYWSCALTADYDVVGWVWPAQASPLIFLWQSCSWVCCSHSYIRSATSLVLVARRLLSSWLAQWFNQCAAVSSYYSTRWDGSLSMKFGYSD